MRMPSAAMVVTIAVVSLATTYAMYRVPQVRAFVMPTSESPSLLSRLNPFS